MRFKCVKDYKARVVDYKGFLQKPIFEDVRIEGISEGAIYTGQIVAETYESNNGIVKSILKVVIFNDLQEWSEYDISLFIPKN